MHAHFFQTKRNPKKRSDLFFSSDTQIFISLVICFHVFTFLLQLKDLESQTGVTGSGDVGSSSSEAPTKELVARLEKECKEQEELLARFQSENKRLYEEIRSKEKAAKATEEAMFKENQRLNAEMTSVRLVMFGCFFFFFGNIHI